MFHLQIWILLLCIFLMPDSLHAQKTFKKKAITWQATYLADPWYGIYGQRGFNINRGLGGKLTYLGLADLKINFDFEKLKKWKGATLVAEGQNLHSDLPAISHVRTYQGFDNIEFDGLREMTYLYQLYWQQEVNRKFSFLFGLYDINNEFDVTNSSLTLILPTFGLGTDLGQTGRYGPSTYPITGLSLRLKYLPTKKTYVIALATDALAGNPLNPASPQFDFSQGTLNIVEVGRLVMDKANKEALGKYSLGLWAYSDKMALSIPEEFSNPDIINLPERNAGWYALIDYPLFVSNTADKKILHGFIRYGYVNPEANLFAQALSAGLTWNGFIPKRPDDVISLGIAPAWTSATIRNEIIGFPSVEWQQEITYSAKIASWLLLQADLQYIHFDGNDSLLFQDTVLAGLRVSLLCAG